MKITKKTLTVSLLLFSAVFMYGFILAGDNTVKVKVKKKYYHEDGTRCYSDWIEYDTRLLSSLQDFNMDSEPKHRNNGARIDKKYESTGYFRVSKINNRWWLIDPEGYLFIHRGVVSVKAGASDNQKNNLITKFGDEVKWFRSTEELLNVNGFNGAGNWSDAGLILEHSDSLVYTRGFNFMSGYGKKRGGTFQQPGHTGYPNDLIFVFDPQFKEFCDKEAAKCLEYKNEKNLLGYFSDNELPFPADALDRFLTLKTDDPGYVEANKWLVNKKGDSADKKEVTDEDRSEFLNFMAERYFAVVSSAIKKYDPNHLYLGSRFHGQVKNSEPVFRAAGKYADIISVNLYDVWTPEQKRLNNWVKWSGKPFLITEWYAKAEDSGMKNISGAGWIVPTQQDRGYFYQNFTLALLESRGCVGWHWFKYQDNDPADKSADPSNEDSNKGIVDNNYEPYAPVLEQMKAINCRVYSLIDYFDAK